ISEKAGAQVRDVALPKICEEAYTAHRTIQDYEGFQALAFEFDNHYDRLPPILRALLEDARTLSAQDYDDARRIASHARRALKDAFGDFDVLLTPSAESAAPHGLSSTGSPAFNKFWTLIGTPCVNVPGQRDAMGLPLGVQVIARFGKDHAALEAAWFLERAMRRDAA
ncbi:MAG TPA: amidase family protein, partial [Burkholderiaceae bacterium]|nr:amidase family protein [Burkholderiaceae bacterium]